MAGRARLRLGVPVPTAAAASSPSSAPTPSTSSRVISTVDPVTGGAGADVSCASDADVDAAVARAEQARRGWRTTPAGGRAAALRVAAAAVRAAAPDLGAALTATTGRLLGQSVESAQVAADLLDEAAVTGVQGAGRSLDGDLLSVDVVRREPHGVVAVITPWNDPFPAAAGLLAAALVTGNTVVHKPSERSSAPGAVMAVLIAAALPSGVLEVLTGDGVVGARIVADPRVHLVAQVGSTATGRAIAAATGARGARCLVENGGKDPIVVDDGVDPAWAAGQIALGAFTNTGQLCVAVERVYLHEGVADAVLAELVGLADAMVVGDPSDPATTLGPLVDEGPLAAVAAHVDQALAAGATALTGGARLERTGSFDPATVLTGCTEEMAVMREETFGPVAPVTVVASFEEGLELAGRGDFGLAATVLTPSTERALVAAAELEVGTVKVNAVFGGAPGGSADPRRSSGSGRGFGPDLLGEMTVLKAVHLEGAPPAP